jgi:hypothetical protein
MLMVAAVSVLLALAFDRGATSGELRLGSVVFGIGMGFANTALIIAVQTSVGFSQRGVATASTMFFRNIGGTVGVGVMGVVLARALLASETARSAGGAELVARILGPERRSVDPAVLHAISGDLAAGLGRVLWIIAGLGLVAAIASVFFPAVSTADATPSKR